MSVDVAEVNRLLAESRAAHEAKKRKAGVIDRDGRVVTNPNWPEAEQHIVEALRLRVEAHALDPDHTAPGWSVPIPPAKTATPDAELIRFYVAYAKPYIPADVMAQIIERFPQYGEIEYIP